MDSEETERLIEMQHWPQEIRPMLGSVEEHFSPSVGDWMSAPASTRENLVYMAKVLAGSLGGAAIGSQVVKSLSASGRSKEVILREEDLINSSKMPKGKSTKFGPGSRPESHVPQPTLVHKAGKIPIYQYKMTNSVVPMSVSNTLSHETEFIDSKLLMTSGESRLTKIRMNLGKQQYPDVITPFLKNLNGHATLRMQWAGRCVSGVNDRHTHFQMFRHRLSQGDGYNKELGPATTAPYASLMRPYIMDPANNVVFAPAGGSSGAGWSTGSTSFRDFASAKTYWAPYNLADLEDCSWNLNALKLYPLDIPGIGSQPKFANNVGQLQPDQHWRSSFLAYNNSQVADTTTRAATYRYKAVLNKGSVAYQFMNKGTGGAKVEVIVYRLKKNVATSATGSTLAGDASYCNKMLTQPIGTGYLNTCIAKAGTDLLDGRPPAAADVFSNALYPLLKNYKLTKQSDLPFVEIARQSFGMPSGSRRDVEIILPGIVYDPENQTLSNNTSTSAAGFPGPLDEHQYCIFIATCGAPCTQELVSGNINYNVGDMISKADIQFYATYTEHIGACAYKDPVHKPLYCQGGLLDPLSETTASASGGWRANPVVMVPQTSAARTPATNTDPTTGDTTAGTNLTTDFAAEPV